MFYRELARLELPAYSNAERRKGLDILTRKRGDKQNVQIHVPGERERDPAADAGIQPAVS
jgi:hypothetical protein